MDRQREEQLRAEFERVQHDKAEFGDWACRSVPELLGAVRELRMYARELRGFLRDSDYLVKTALDLKAPFK